MENAIDTGVADRCVEADLDARCALNPCSLVLPPSSAAARTWIRPTVDSPARGHEKMRARRVQGATSSHPVSGTARLQSGRAAQGVPRSRTNMNRVRTTRRRTAIRIPCPPAVLDVPPERHDLNRRSFGRACLGARPFPESPASPKTDGTGALVAPAVATGQSRSLVVRKYHVKGVPVGQVRPRTGAGGTVSPDCRFGCRGRDKALDLRTSATGLRRGRAGFRRL